jgi:acetyl-CoA C-acetyltransferase/acetyl-CoA acyltransferase
MRQMRKRIFAAAGYTTTFLGSGRKEFDPTKPMPGFESYLLETAKGTCAQIPQQAFEEGVIGSFMASRFIKQANLPGFLPFMVPSLLNKACLAVEGACGTGGRAIGVGIRSILADLADAVFVAGFEIQNTVKAVYGADILAGAAYYNKERKGGQAFFFPGIFAERAGAYYERYGYDYARQAMARWYELSILNARKNPKAQEYANTAVDLIALGMSKPDPAHFVPNLNHYDCSKVSDGAASIGLFSEEGLKKCAIPRDQIVEIIAVGEAEGDITQAPNDLTVLNTTEVAVQQALKQADIALSDLGWLELHDCFTITGILALEAIGFALKGKGPEFVMEGKTGPEGLIPTNLSGGLGGFGHPTGATGVRQLVDLQQQLTGQAAHQIPRKKEYGMMISMGGNDKTVTCIIVKIP